MTPSPSNYVPGVRRRQTTPLFDTFTGAAGNIGPTVVMFGRTAGANGINITNMTQPFQLPGTDAFLVQAVRFVPIGVTEADLQVAMRGLILRLIRGRAVELEAGLEYFSGGAGIVTPTAASVQTSNGLSDPRAVASLGENPIRIEGGDHFEVHLTGPAAVAQAATYWYRVYLDGWFDKGVQ